MIPEHAAAGSAGTASASPAASAASPSAARDCELCRGVGLCPQCDGYGCPPDGSIPAARCSLCMGESWCPQCTGTGEAAAVGS